MEKRPVQIMIHDLTPWGGQDRSMLEIAWRMNKYIQLEIHSYRLEGYKDWPQMKHIQYESLIQRPILFKYLSYHRQSAKKVNSQMVTQSTGTASLKSDIVQVQFIHQAWERMKAAMPQDKLSKPGPLKAVYHQWLTKYKLALEKRLYTQEKKYIAISHGIKKELIEHFSIPPDKISIIYHGVDTEEFVPSWALADGESLRTELRTQLGYAESDIVLLHVGALNARKGIFKSLEVMKMLRDHDFHNVKLLAVGQGDPKLLHRRIKQFEIEDRVQIVPHSKQIQRYYQAADIFFFPTMYEPFGLVILEAMACGLPIFTTTVAGASELLTHGKNAVLVAPDAPVKELVNKLALMIKNEPFRKLQGDLVRNIAVRHDWDQVGKEYRKFYFRHFREIEA